MLEGLSLCTLSPIFQAVRLRFDFLFSFLTLLNRLPTGVRQPENRRAGKPGLFAVVLSIFLSRFAWGQTTIRNGGFEEVGANGLPIGWHITKAGEPDHEEGGEIEIKTVDGIAHSGNRAVELHSEISSFPAFFDQNLDAQGRGPLPVRGTISFWYKVIEGTIGRLAVTVLGVGAKRDYPGGFYIPVTFADDGAWHYAEVGYDLSGDPGVKSAFVRIYVMSFEIGYPAPTKFLIDDVQYLPDEPTYFSPRLFHIIEGNEPDACEMRVYLRNMSLRPATAHVRIVLPSHLKADESEERSIDLPAGGIHGFFMNDPGGSGVVKWVVRGRRQPGDVVAVRLKADAAEKSWTWKRELKPDLQIANAAFSRGLIAPEEKVQLEVSVRNNGHAYSPAGAMLQLFEPPTLKTFSPLTQSIASEVGPGQTVKVLWTLGGTRDGIAEAAISLRPRQESTTSLSAHAKIWLDAYAQRLEPAIVPKSWQDLALVSSGNLFLSLGPRRDEYGPLSLYYYANDKFTDLASAPFLGKVVYLEKSGETEKIIRYRPNGRMDRDVAFLIAAWKDADGVSWRSTIEFRAPGSRERIDVTSTLEADEPREILAFQGPFLLIGDGTAGIRKDSAQFPGIEWLEDGEMSSNQSHIPALRDQRVPHPNKITVPSMGVVIDRKMIGIMWDPLQRWDGDNDRPSALFDSPNRIYGQANHLMGLFLPSIPNWVPQGRLKASSPYPLRPNTKLKLQFSIIASDNADALSPTLYWYKTHGAADPPQLDRTFEEELALSGISSKREINVESKILQSLTKAEKALQKQGPDGWWPWTYSDTTFNTTLNFTWGNNLDDYGLKGETAIGAYSPTNSGDENIELFRAARYTGNPRLVDASLRALRQAEQFKRPEGASPWELPLHVPDLLGSPYGVLAFLEGYKLTGDKRWLERARWWAKTGLPFIYVWGAEDQPHMKYAGIPDFGGSFLDYLLLGQGVTWVAMRYAESLVRLSDYDPEGPWKKIAQGILYNCMLQHEMRGKNVGQWPDWRDLIKNRVLVDVWYSDPRIGELLLKWLGRDPEPETTVVKVTGKEIRITADSEVLEARYQEGRLSIKLKPLLQPVCHVAIAGVEPFNQARIISPLQVASGNVSYDRKYGMGFVQFDTKGATTVILDTALSPSR